MSRDPLGPADSWNLQQALHSSPLASRDPFGLLAQSGNGRCKAESKWNPDPPSRPGVGATIQTSSLKKRDGKLTDDENRPCEFFGIKVKIKPKGPDGRVSGSWLIATGQQTSPAPPADSEATQHYSKNYREENIREDWFKLGDLISREEPKKVACGTTYTLELRFYAESNGPQHLTKPGKEVDGSLITVELSCGLPKSDHIIVASGGAAGGN